MAEFQAIILAGGSGVRLAPLTEDTPKSMLPANGKPLLWYQLNLLENAGFTDAIVVTVAEQLPALQDYVSRVFDGKIHVELCEVEDGTDSAVALRQIADKIKKDFIVIAGDLLTDAVVHNVADCHRMNDATVTMLLKQEPPRTDKAKGEKPRRGKDTVDCIALDERDSRVVMIAPTVHMDEDLFISKALTKRRTNFTLHSDLYDAHFYIFSRWVIDLLVEKERIVNIKLDLIPHLIRRQFRGRGVLPESVRDKAVRSQHLAASLSLTTQEYDAEDVVRCFAYVLPTNAYCERADTLAAYHAIDGEVKSRLRIRQRSPSV